MRLAREMGWNTEQLTDSLAEDRNLEEDIVAEGVRRSHCEVARHSLAVLERKT